MIERSTGFKFVDKPGHRQRQQIAYRPGDNSQDERVFYGNDKHIVIQQHPRIIFNPVKNRRLQNIKSRKTQDDGYEYRAHRKRKKDQEIWQGERIADRVFPDPMSQAFLLYTITIRPSKHF